MGKRFQLLQGNEAVVEGGIAAGMRFYAGYPITPSTEIAERSALRLPQVGGKFIQMEDEIGGIAAALGASVAGLKAMTATSGPGFSLKQENIGYAAIAEIPIVIVDVQREGPSTGLPTSPSQGDLMQSKWGTHGDHPVIVISPSSVQECYTETVRAFNMAERFRVPVIFLMDEIIGHLREGCELIPPEELTISDRKVDRTFNGTLAYAVQEGNYVPEYAPFGEGDKFNVTGLFHDLDGFPTNDNNITDTQERRLLDKIRMRRDRIQKWEEVECEDCETMIICFGGTARAVQGAMEDAKKMDFVKIGMFRPITVWPFPEEALLKVIKENKHLRQIIVAEHNDGQMLLEVQRIVEGRVPVDFLGKIDGTTITPTDVIDKVKEVY
ncbi:MAG: 2-oxoacid:acceptor oxidoreductase subunit alpha [Firmicutes bacterium]|nr:2-oxoacid:acceptor oxidoreductase subunit alpha [Bacillota bacterium]